jgi:P63C domain
MRDPIVYEFLQCEGFCGVCGHESETVEVANRVTPPEQRSEIAKKAAVARWGEKPAEATHLGSFKADFGLDIDCYVLNDEQKTAVISQRGMAEALGLDRTSGTALSRFVSGQTISKYLGEELVQKLQNPVVFQWQPVGANKQLQPIPGGSIHGYDVTILIDICKAVIRAHDDGQLKRQQEHIPKQAHVILNASAKAGIKGLVYALAGYDSTKAEVIAAFKFYVREEAREYEKEFPDQLYNEWYRLYELPRPEKNKPWKFMHLTINQVYYPLARSKGKILELTRSQRASSGSHNKKLHQFLAEIGVKALRTHLGQLLGIAQVSDSRSEYEKRVEKVFGSQQSFDFEE